MGRARLRERCAVILVPGIFGFDQLGPSDAPRVEYFAGVIAELMRATGWPREQFMVHGPPPTGPLSARVKSLHEKVARVLSEDPSIARVHLVGHSTGGLDSRLLVNLRYSWPGAPDPGERMRVAGSVRKVITIAAPFAGTPLARRLRGGLSALVPFLHVLSILLMHRGLEPRSRWMLAGMTALRQLLPGRHREPDVGRPFELALELVASRDRRIAEQVVALLREIVRDQRLHGDLTPEAMADLNEQIAGADADSIASFVTVSPPPTWALPDRHLPARLFYAAAYRFAMPRGEARRPFPGGPWLVDPEANARADAALRSEVACDGILPAASQVLDGARAAGIVLADHLDVIGHFEGSPVGATYLKSGAGFTTASFSILWGEVGLRLKQADEEQTSAAA